MAQTLTFTEHTLHAVIIPALHNEFTTAVLEQRWSIALETATALRSIARQCEKQNSEHLWDGQVVRMRQQVEAARAERKAKEQS